VVNNTTTRTVLPAVGRSWDEDIAEAQELLRRYPDDSPLRREILWIIDYARNLKIHASSLIEVIEYNKKKPPHQKWPQRIEVKNEFGTMFEIDFRTIPPVQSSAQKQPDFFKYTSIYFDGELVMVQETGMFDVDFLANTAVPQPSVTVFNRLSPELEGQLKTFFQGGN
jgi:hypothetical protein